MTTRTDVKTKALSFDGYLNGAGYNGENKFAEDLGLPPEAWCGIFVTDVFKQSALELPSMQAGMATGFAFVPDAEYIAEANVAWTASWNAAPADLVLFDWNGDGNADHVEMVTSYDGTALYTIGGNSGPSNLPGNPYTGEGGVHQHIWTAPKNVGNSQILGVVDTGKLVSFSAVLPPAGDSCTPLPLDQSEDSVEPPAWGGLDFSYLSTKPMMHNDDIKKWQCQMIHRRITWIGDADGYYGQKSRSACRAFQTVHGWAPTGIVDRVTWARTWTTPIPKGGQ